MVYSNFYSELRVYFIRLQVIITPVILNKTTGRGSKAAGWGGARLAHGNKDFNMSMFT